MQKQVDNIRLLAKVVPQGPWEIDSEKQEDADPKYNAYVLFDEKHRRMCGTENADNSFVELVEEYADDESNIYDKASFDLITYLVATSPQNLLKIFDWYESRIKEVTNEK